MLHLLGNKIIQIEIKMLNYKIQIAFMKTFVNENHYANLIPMI